MENSPSRSPSGIVANDVASKPGPLRRAFGWLLIAVSPVFCFPFVVLFQQWDRLGQANSPLWILPIVMLCYAAFTAAFVCVGSGLVSGRTQLAKNGCLLFVGMLIPFWTLFVIFD